MRWPSIHPWLTATGVAAALLAPVARAEAHEIPAALTAHVIVRPDGQRLHVVVRVPLRAMRDVNFPLEGPGYLTISKADQTLRDAAMLWLAPNIAIYEDGIRIGSQTLVRARVSLPSDRSFGSYEDALLHLTGPPLADTERLVWDAALLDTLFEYPIRSDRSNFSARLEFTRLASRVTTVLRFNPPGGVVRAFEYTGDPGLIRLDPRWHQAALRFVALGISHILEGIDHLLFLLCLVIPFQRLRPLVLIVTSFTVAHSITLIASASGLAPGALWFPPLVETLIAVSIVYMALENIIGTVGVRRRWVATFLFGLVHGFGFSFALRESLQFAGSHLLTSLLAFNLGVELGQLAVLAVMVPVLRLVFRAVGQRMGAIILSALAAHSAWHWMAERWQALRAFGWPG